METANETLKHKIAALIFQLTAQMGDLLEDVSDTVLTYQSYVRLEFSADRKIDRLRVRNLVETITQLQDILNLNSPQDIEWAISKYKVRDCLNGLRSLRTELFGLKNKLVEQFNSRGAEIIRLELVTGRSENLERDEIQRKLAIFEFSSFMCDLNESFAQAIEGFNQEFRNISGLGILLTSCRNDGYFVSTKYAKTLFDPAYIKSYLRPESTSKKKDKGPSQRGRQYLQKVDLSPSITAPIQAYDKAVLELFERVKRGGLIQGFEGIKVGDLHSIKDLKDEVLKLIEPQVPERIEPQVPESGEQGEEPELRWDSRSEAVMLRANHEDKKLSLHGKNISCDITQPSLLKLLVFLTDDKHRGILATPELIYDFLFDLNLITEDEKEKFIGKRLKDWMYDLRVFLREHDETWVRNYRILSAKRAGGYRLEVKITTETARV